MQNEADLQVATALSTLACKIMLREPPFRNLDWPNGVLNCLVSKFHQYRSEIPSRMEREFVDYVVKSCQESLRWAFGLYGKTSFADRFPEAMVAKKKFGDWLSEKEGISPMPFIRSYRPEPSLDVNNIIRGAFLKRYPQSKPARNKPALGVRTFCKPLTKNKLFFGFERSNLRTFMSFFVGLERPWFMLDIGSFFCVQSRFDYVKSHEYLGEIENETRLIIEMQMPQPQDVMEVTQTALNLMESLLPHILICLSSVDETR
ncbi:MAG: hypothetical protein ACLP2X_15660 [Syntrophobacteraceae bacterium]